MWDLFFSIQIYNRDVFAMQINITVYLYIEECSFVIVFLMSVDIILGSLLDAGNLVLASVSDEYSKFLIHCFLLFCALLVPGTFDCLLFLLPKLSMSLAIMKGK